MGIYKYDLNKRFNNMTYFTRNYAFMVVDQEGNSESWDLTFLEALLCNIWFTPTANAAL